MCGISGFVGKGSEQDLLAMIEVIRYRGPDDLGSFVRGDVGLAHARLSILDLSAAGHQPMWNDKKDVAIIFNGEIYNFQELKRDFGMGYHFVSNTDTEVILCLYEKLGEECFEKLDGMFAIAIYDFKRNKLLLARDRIGEKPLYWGVFDKTFIFASELNAFLRHPSVARELDHSALAEYLIREYVPTPKSIFKNIYKLEPSHILTYQNGEVAKKSFWDIPVETRKLEFKEALAHLHLLLEKSIKERLVADVPVGIFLSGGIDSSTIAYYASKASDKQVKTFSIGFWEESFDESSYAKQVATFLGTDHYHQIVTAKDSLRVLNSELPFMGEPLADPTIIPTLLLSKFTREKVTVALGGEGGDELLAGYPTFQADKLTRFYQGIPSVIRKFLINPIINSLPVSDKHFSLSFKLQKFVEGASSKPLERHDRWLQAFNQEDLSALLAEDVYRDASGANLYTKAEDHSPQGILNSYLYSYLSDGVLTKVDRASMQYALEVRAPFLGKELVEFLSTIPYEYKLHGFKTKYILKELMKDKLPKNIVYRGKKGFGLPVSEWLKKDMKPLLLELLSRDKLREQKIFNPDYVDKLVDEHLSGAKNHAKKLWTLMMFQLWFGSFMK